MVKQIVEKNFSKIVFGFLALAALAVTGVVGAVDEANAAVKAGVQNVAPRVWNGRVELLLENAGRVEVLASFRAGDGNGAADLVERQCVLYNKNRVVSTAPVRLGSCAEISCAGECRLLLAGNGEGRGGRDGAQGGNGEGSGAVEEGGDYQVEISVADEAGEKARETVFFQYHSGGAAPPAGGSGGRAETAGKEGGTEEGGAAENEGASEEGGEGKEKSEGAGMERERAPVGKAAQKTFFEAIAEIISNIFSFFFK